MVLGVANVLPSPFPFLSSPQANTKSLRIELTLGIMAASLPSLKPLFNWFLETAKSLTTKSRSHNGTYKRNSSLNYFKSDTHKGAFELESVAASERANKGRELYSVKVTGEGWDEVEKGMGGSSEEILPIQGGGSDEGIRVTTKVVVL